MKGFTCTIIAIILLQVLPLSAFSQDTIRKEQTIKNCFTLDLGRFVWNEARFGYERLIKDDFWWRFIVGFQYPTSESFENASFTYSYGHGYEPMYNRVSTGIYLGTGISVYMKDGSDRYISIEPYYNYAFYNQKYFNYNSSHSPDDKVSLESMRQSKTGIKILYGKKFREQSIGKARFEMDMFAGVGIQYRLRDITQFEYLGQDGIFRPYDPLRKEEHENVYPTLHVGLLIGIPFGIR